MEHTIKTKFSVRDKVYYVSRSEKVACTVPCRACKGTGTITVVCSDAKTYVTDCPAPKCDYGEVTVYKKSKSSICCGTIETVFITMEHGDRRAPDIEEAYELQGVGGTWSPEDLYVSQADVEKAITKKQRS